MEDIFFSITVCWSLDFVAWPQNTYTWAYSFFCNKSFLDIISVVISISLTVGIL